MKAKAKGVKCINISGEYIKLDALLKYASLVSTGGEAKNRIKSGEVVLNGIICLSRGKKIKQGDVVRMGESVILVRSKTL